MFLSSAAHAATPGHASFWCVFVISVVPSMCAILLWVWPGVIAALTSAYVATLQHLPHCRHTCSALSMRWCMVLTLLQHWGAASLSSAGVTFESAHLRALAAGHHLMVCRSGCCFRRAGSHRHVAPLRHPH